MKSFPIGDRQKRITCPDAYLADLEGEGTTVLWHPDSSGFAIRVSVITIKGKDNEGADYGLLHVIHETRERGEEPQVVGNKSILSYREPAEEPNTTLHFTHVGMGDHICIFSIASATGEETSRGFIQIQAALREMIDSLEERQESEHWICELLESERESICTATLSCCGAARADDTWQRLQTHLDRAYEQADEPLAGQVGLAFGELIREEVTSLKWCSIIDDDGSALALKLDGSNILLFPEAMILKRFDRREHLDLLDFSVSTIDLLEEAFREEQSSR
jgi:hypothetical protein